MCSFEHPLVYENVCYSGFFYIHMHIHVVKKTVMVLKQQGSIVLRLYNDTKSGIYPPPNGVRLVE